MVEKGCGVMCVAMLILLLGGCVFGERSDEKVDDWPFAVVEAEELPEEVLNMIDAKKEKPFQMAYHESDITYIILGYGQQETSGYHIEVHDVYQGTDSLWVDTDLIGPRKDASVDEHPSYPYVVIKTEKVDQLVRFKS